MTGLPPARALLFDWDGTLVNNWPVIVGALNDTLVRWGQQPWPMAEAMERISRSQRDSFPIIFGDDWEAARDHFYDRFLSRHLTDMEVIAGAPEVLDRLADAGVWMGVVSNKRGDFLRREADHLRWTGYFARLVGANDAEEDKPSAAPVLLALSGSGIRPGPDVWFVGDSATDVQTARTAGCTAVLLRAPGGNPTPLPDGLAADLELDRLAGLADLVAPAVQAIYAAQ